MEKRSIGRLVVVARTILIVKHLGDDQHACRSPWRAASRIRTGAPAHVKPVRVERVTVERSHRVRTLAVVIADERDVVRLHDDEVLRQTFHGDHSDAQSHPSTLARGSRLM